ncbi:LytR C-terminal domain-containing protein [Leifsonia sp. A12D58]|uniref:LytR C-terminal domain-containing protein n=1 Tax=Leifsonia sp. A12D58 TaxID=3397674 RepID=UPI0039E1114F
MPKKPPKDRFDSLQGTTERVGAHRTTGKKGRGWVTLAWALAATLVLVGLGAIGLLALNNRLNFEMPGTTPSTTAPVEATSEAPAPPAVEPTLDPSISITVLNGTPGTGVAAAVGQTLTDAGWSVGATSNASTEDVPTTVVYYSDASYEGAALGVASAIPGATTSLSPDFAESDAAITVIVGNDYVPAG